MIELKHLNKIYEGHGAARTHAVRDVSLQLPDRGMVAIFGRSGCGKTTLLNCIGGLDRASGGSAAFDGEAVTPSATELRNRHIGYIFQNYNLSKGMTVFENVAVSLRLCGVRDEKEIERRVMAALESVDMEKYRKRMPDALSGGQQQRVAIARAIVKNPALILADEPTGNLDEQNTVLVMDLLREISKEHLVLLVTHEASLVDLYCDRVIEMADGRVVQDRENAVTGGFCGKSANEIYLGDLPLVSHPMGEGVLEQYGDPADMPTHIRLISVGGTLYVQAQSNLKLRLIDRDSEVLLREGKYEERAAREAREISPTLCEPLPAGESGKLYRFSNAVKSGFRANFSKTRRGKKLLIAALGCFPVVIALVLAIFGTVFYELERVEETYNPNTVFVRCDTDALSTLREHPLVDNIFITRYGGGESYPRALTSYCFSIGNFETFLEESSTYFYAEGLMLPTTLLTADTKMLCGTAVTQNEDQIVISRGYADLLLEQVGVDFIRDYEDLLYIVGRDGGWDASAPAQSVVGITDETEAVVYLSPYRYTQNLLMPLYSCGRNYISDVEHSGMAGLSLSRGEIYLVDARGDKSGKFSEAIRVGDRVNIANTEFTVKDIVSQELDEEQFVLWVYAKYGRNIYESLSAYSEWYWGYDATDAEEWNQMNKGGGWTHAQALKELELAFKNDYDSDLWRFTEISAGSLPTVVMHREDFLALCSALPTGKENNTFYAMYTDWAKSGNPYYALHTEQPQRLCEEMIALYGDASVTTPDEMREFEASLRVEELLVACVVILCVSLVMALCLYFIMRSSLMSDIKEVGTLRAIGVSRRNLVFRYLIETLVLFALTVFVGYVLSSAALLGIGSLHQSMAQLLYYPWWMALLAFVWLLGVSVICGLLPILSLLRRTPAEILSKYDI